MKIHAAFKFALCLLLGLGLCGCLRAPVVPPGPSPLYSTGGGFRGGFGGVNAFSNLAFPVDIAYGPNDIGKTSGKAKSCSVLGLIAWGDSTVATAAKNANIKQIDHIDATFFNIIGIYQEYNTVVWGKTAAELPTPTQ